MSKRGFTHYVVFVGICPGIYDSWDQCKQYVLGVSMSKYKGYHSYEAASKAFQEYNNQHKMIKP
ncbi:MAG: RNase H1/viroplasmin domain-containing protein [Cyclobacteriaceae bacterium]